MFITLEGIDRSGKTTQAAMLAEALGPGTVSLREPGGTPAGERIRDLLKDPELELGPGTELLLFNAARAELCREVVRPALDDGHDVVCDRFIDSTVAYQGVARGLGVDVVERLSELVVGSCLPDLTVLLRVDPELAGARDGRRVGPVRVRGAGVSAPGGGRLRRARRAPPGAVRGRRRDRRPGGGPRADHGARGGAAMRRSPIGRSRIPPLLRRLT